MSELVGKQSEQFMCEMFNVRTSWQIVALSHRKICSLDIVSFCVLVENSCSLSPDEFFIGPCLIFPQSHFLSSLSFAELKNLPLWWTCHMVQYNRGGGKMGIRGFFSDKIGKRENWKSRRTKLCSKKISKNESLGNSEETAKFALKSSQIGLFTCKEGMALLQNLVLNCLKYNLFFSQLGKGCCVSLDYFNSCTITTTVYYTVYSYSGNTTKNEITTF